MSMDDSEAAGRLGGYADMILGIDDTVNPVGVECWMRLQYGTLDHLPRETFAAEAAMAKVGEELQPGSLREIAGTYGSAERYDIAQGIIDARAKARDEAAAGDPLVADFIAGGGRPAASFSSLDIGWDPRAHDFPVSVLMSAAESGAQLSVVYDDGRGPDRRQRVVTGTAQEVAERLGQQGYAVELQPPGRGPASFSLPPGEDGEAAGDRLAARDRLAAERERLNAEHAASVPAIDAEIAALGGFAAAPGKRDGGTPPDRGGRMSRGRPAGDIIEREAREAGEEVEPEEVDSAARARPWRPPGFLAGMLSWRWRLTGIRPPSVSSRSRTARRPGREWWPAAGRHRAPRRSPSANTLPRWPIPWALERGRGRAMRSREPVRGRSRSGRSRKPRCRPAPRRTSRFACGSARSGSAKTSRRRSTGSSYAGTPTGIMCPRKWRPRKWRPNSPNGRLPT